MLFFAMGCTSATARADEVEASISRCGLEGQIEVDVEGEGPLHIRRIDSEAAEGEVDCFFAEVERLQLPLGTLGDEAPQKPSEAVVHSIEQRLALDPCIGSMHRWFRKFAYGLNRYTHGADTSIIWFSLHEAGKYEFKPGRSITDPKRFANIDDRPKRYASGTFRPATGDLEIAYCGDNAR